MIADLRFVADVPGGAVSVEMFWEGGRPMGLINVPGDIMYFVLTENLPSLDALPLMSAVAYAMTLANIGETDLVVTGEASAWLPRWGRLITTG